MRFIPGFILIILIALSSVIGYTPTQAVEIPNGGISPQFSPDGKYIAFLSSSPHLPKTIWLMDIDGTTIKNLSFGNVIDFTWANNPRLIRYTAHQNRNPVLSNRRYLNLQHLIGYRLYRNMQKIRFGLLMKN